MRYCILASEDLQHAAAAPNGNLAPALSTAVAGLFGLDQAQHEAPQQAEAYGPVTAAHPASDLPEGRVRRPVCLVLYTPVNTHRGERVRCTGGRPVIQCRP